MQDFVIKPIAHIYTFFTDKFGIPRQSGMVDNTAKIIFEPNYRNPDAVRKLEEFSHIWLIWQFSKSVREDWSPTVRPPRLGGNEKVGVFATRSPFRPNSLGLSSVKLLKIELTKDIGPIIYVSGADILDGTPIFDIKPYIKYSDCHIDATNGFTDNNPITRLKVEYNCNITSVDNVSLNEITQILSLDPRPSYKNDSERIYKLDYNLYNIEFKVNNGIVSVLKIKPFGKQL